MSPLLRRPRVRIVAGVLVVAVLAATAFVVARASAKKSPAAAATTRSVAVTSGPMDQTVSASGTLAPAKTEDLSFTSSGKVTAVNVKAGQTVKKGQVLATIDSAALASAVVQAEAQVAADQSTLETDEDGDASSAQLTADRANLASDQSQLADARTALAGASLVSPIAGVVAGVDLTVGEQLGSNGASASSPNASAPTSNENGDSSGSTAQIEVVSKQLVVNLDVDDTEIAQIKAGQSATVSPSSSTSGNSGRGNFGNFGGFGGPVFNQSGPTNNGANGNTNGNGATTTPTPTTSATAKVTSVGAIASASSGVATFPVVVTVTGSTTGLYSGATAQATITYNTIANAVQVPALAVSRSNGQATVKVVADGKTTTRVVTTGITSNGMIQITTGLQAGEQVVLTVPAAATNRSSNNNGGGEQPGGTFTFPAGGGFKGPGQ